MVQGFGVRRGWDSNPRAVADKRFSRPPRYDLFDTPASNHASDIISKSPERVNHFLKFICYYSQLNQY